MKQQFSNKIRFFLLFGLLFQIGICVAQDGQSRFIPNIHAGMAGSQVSGDGLGGFDKFGFQAGLGIHTDIGNQFDLGFELNLLQKGSIRRPDPENNDYRKYKMALLYTQVPLFLRYNINDKLAALAGPAIGILLSAKESDFDGEISTGPEFNKVEFSGIIELQYLLSPRLRSGIRLDQSLFPIRRRGNTGYAYMDGRQYNIVLGLYLYYSIN